MMPDLFWPAPRPCDCNIWNYETRIRWTCPLLPAHGRWVIALAAFLGEVRLIDNVVVER